MPWYVIETKCGADQWRLASRQLEDRGYTVYAPLCREADAKAVDSKVMFPWYLFVERAAGETNWLEVDRTPGVKAVLRPTYRQPPRALRPGVVEGLLGLERGGAIELVPRFKAGQGLRIRSGPFAGFEGIVSRKAGKRVTALLSLLGGRVEVEVDEGNAEPLEAPYRMAV